MGGLGLLRRPRPPRGADRRARSLEALAPVVPIPVRLRHRPEPALRFTDLHAVPDGAFAAIAIPNDALRHRSVPQRGAPWETIEEFALSYDGYGYWSGLADLAGRSIRAWTRDCSLPDSLDELRACLFYEQRRWHHFGQEPYGKAADYLGALLEAITDRVRALKANLAEVTRPAQAG
jgi:hypothetical protein